MRKFTVTARITVIANDEEDAKRTTDVILTTIHAPGIKTMHVVTNEVSSEELLKICPNPCSGTMHCVHRIPHKRKDVCDDPVCCGNRCVDVTE